MWIYVVQSGDSVNTIADRYGISLDALIYNNQLEYPYRLAVGQALLMPGANENTNRLAIVSNGYAYPFISPWVLEQTLPYLTEIAIFSYGFTGQGELVPPVMDDTWVIRAAEEFETLPILTLTPFGPDGQFNNNLITAVVNNPAAEQQLFENLRIVMQEKGYRGLDIDFEYILASDRDAFTRFVQNAVAFFNALGYQVSVALAPKTSSDQVGLLYEGKDYPALGAAANRVLLMTYEWGYTYVCQEHRSSIFVQLYFRNFRINSQLKVSSAFFPTFIFFCFQVFHLFQNRFQKMVFSGSTVHMLVDI